MLCIAPCYLYPYGSPFVPFTWWHLQWGHIYRTPTLAVHNPLWAKFGHLSVNELWLSSFSFFFTYSFPLSCCLMKDEVLNSSAATSLWGRHSSICDPSWCNWILHTECDMEHDLGVSPLLPFSLFFHSNHSKVFAAGHLGSLFMCWRLTLLMMTDDKREAKPLV